ncbi:hypothetical protein BN3456_00025 [Clostridium sp. C105KSO13]|nr:hypothetical protein BN3456_00025 [Clostridium sp. C105KSO13]
MFKEIQYLIGNRFALHLKHKLNIIMESKFSVSGKITFRIFTEHEMNFIQFCNTVVESLF